MSTQPARPPTTFEPLEPRTLLEGSPYPALALLEDPAHTVVRLETRYGDVDIELLDSVAPGTVAAFLQTLRRGEYAGTFFHDHEPGVALRAGLHRLDPFLGPDERFSLFPVDTPPTRSNQVMTVAMPVLNPQTTPQGTTELVFNLADNPAADTQFAVFGRVVQGWDAILQIAGLPTIDLSPFFFGNPVAAELNRVPATEGSPSAVTDGVLVPIGDLQVIKPGGIAQFYTEKAYYPEGYSWERIFEAVELLNPGGGAASYQVIVRYEDGPRDQVVATGELGAGRRETVVVAPGFGNRSGIVRNYVPYAYEVWSTAPLAAALRHKDFGAGVGEAFLRPQSLPVPGDAHVWSFYQAALGFDPQRVFLLWQNTTGMDATVWATLFFQDAEPIQEVFFLGGHRRGGLSVQNFPGLPPTAFLGARISSDQPIVAAITRYDLPGPGAGGGSAGGLTALGIPGLGSTEGAAPGVATGTQDPFVLLNSTPSDAAVTFFITPEGTATPIIRTAVVPANRLLVLSGGDNPAAAATAGEFFTLRYASTQPVTGGFVTTAFRGPGRPAGVLAAPAVHFPDARGFTAPAGSDFLRQTVWVFNPGTTPAVVNFVFRFDNHAPIIVETLTVVPGLTLRKRLNDYTLRLAQILGGLGELTTRPYSISVESGAPIVAQLTQFDAPGRAELGTTHGSWVALPAL